MDGYGWKIGWEQSMEREPKARLWMLLNALQRA